MSLSGVRGAAKGALLLAVLFHAVGCARVPLARRAEDERAKLAKPQPHTSLLYLYRDESFGGAILMTIELNGARVGETAPDTYFLCRYESSLSLPRTESPSRKAPLSQGAPFFFGRPLAAPVPL